MNEDDKSAAWWAVAYVYGGLTPEQEKRYEKHLGITRKDLEPTYEIIIPRRRRRSRATRMSG